MKNEATSAVQMLAPDGSSVQTLDVVKDLLIEAPIEIVWESVLEEVGTGAMAPNGASMSMKLEAWPGGRWYRDLGEGVGHLWGHVQVIKPPKLLEVTGPLFMSYPAVSHVQYRLIEEGGNTRLKLTHRAIGLLDPEQTKGVHQGWQKIMEGVAAIAKRRVTTGK
jgi:uncharacterized protein YndB with AHSA1/START domain